MNKMKLIALSLALIGNFLGGVWANESDIVTGKQIGRAHV